MHDINATYAYMILTKKLLKINEFNKRENVETPWIAFDSW